ncbi:MAG TPA: coproporphyrinogen III oxidase family protein, partial [Terriglobales bacterium]
SGCESKHNVKYWTRAPYFGFGADAHSMLPAADAGTRDVRFATTGELVDFEQSANHYAGTVQQLTNREALEEAIIVGLRLNRGVDCDQLLRQYGEDPREVFASEMRELSEAGLLDLGERHWRLTASGRLLSNEVFERFLGSKVEHA